jgi:BirA family biotin operon repressor/biotin-[acetyl-CoA-carboxylase] ligase
MGTPNPLEDRLEPAAIAAALGPWAGQVRVEVLRRCGSTNAEALGRALEPDAALLVAAEEQTTGRGRRGRRWHSPAGAGATFSILRQVRCAPGALAGLSLAVGVACARALRHLGAAEAQLKWPNDLLLRGGKLGGILIETRQLGPGTAVVVGIGINCRASEALAARLGRRLAALDESLRPAPPRNVVIGTLAREVLAALEVFAARGLGPFAEDWREMHAHEGRRLRVRLAGGRTLSGIAAGLAPDGALQLRTRAGVRRIASGTIIGAARP